MGRSSLSVGVLFGLGALFAACSSESLGTKGGPGSGGTTGQAGGSGGDLGGGGGSGPVGAACVVSSDCPSGFYCSGNCNAPGGGTCQALGTDVSGSCDPEIGPVCGCDGVTYANQCEAYKNGTSASYGAACALPIGSLCSTATLTGCGGGEYCQVSICGDTTGFCERMPDLATCTGPAEIVCGCDNGLYDSVCAAAANATSVRNIGSCPPLPSGGPCSSQADCGGQTYANLVTCVPATCHGPDGTCQLLGQGCNITLTGTDAYDVCGCDGRTYSDPCVARNAGVTVAYEGDCTVTPDAGASL